MAMACPSGIEATTKIKELVSLPTEQLRLLWTQIFKRGLPPNHRREFLLGALAYELQARTHGTLKVPSHRDLCLFAKDLTKGLQRQAESTAIRPGTQLLRTWQGDTHEVLAREKGFSYRGETYASLSEIARIITGARWSGPLFFGLKVPRPKKPKPSPEGGA
jgi:Protein of unknown function (DUF2924)